MACQRENSNSFVPGSHAISLIAAFSGGGPGRSVSNTAPWGEAPRNRRKTNREFTIWFSQFFQDSGIETPRATEVRRAAIGAGTWPAGKVSTEEQHADLARVILQRNLCLSASISSKCSKGYWYQDSKAGGKPARTPRLAPCC